MRLLLNLILFTVLALSASHCLDVHGEKDMIVICAVIFVANIVGYIEGITRRLDDND